MRTTPQHRFFERDRGWTQANSLKVGKSVRTDVGWAMIEDLFDTGEHETVYNMRVADHHTYFVGDAGWDGNLWAHNDYKKVVEVLQNAPEVKTSDITTLTAIAKGMKQGKSAQDRSLADFTSELETKLVNKGLLERGKHLTSDTAVAAKEAAEVHGNTGRSPSFTVNPGAGNPFTVGTIAYNQWNAISALNSANPTVNAWRLWAQLPGGKEDIRNRGLPYQLSRTLAYAASNELLDVEHPVGGGEADILLTGNRLVDPKAWSQKMWDDAPVGKRSGMLSQLTGEITRYLGDPAGYTLKVEFKYDIPVAVLAQLTKMAADPQYQTAGGVSRLTWAPNV